MEVDYIFLLALYDLQYCCEYYILDFACSWLNRTIKRKKQREGHFDVYTHNSSRIDVNRVSVKHDSIWFQYATLRSAAYVNISGWEFAILDILRLSRIQANGLVQQATVGDSNLPRTTCCGSHNILTSFVANYAS